MEAMFPGYETNQSLITVKDFLRKAVGYFFPEEAVSQQELQLIRKKCKKLLTTTD
jgi:hypothetical protein